MPAVTLLVYIEKMDKDFCKYLGREDTYYRSVVTWVITCIQMVHCFKISHAPKLSIYLNLVAFSILPINCIVGIILFKILSLFDNSVYF